MSNIITRFAPSPTGDLHLGSIRTALYSWLFARNNLGKFILRIEDSDIKRSSNDSVENILKTIKWLNLNWDIGPLFQTKRLNRYNDVINFMIKNKLSYKCYCTKERLDKLRKIQISENKKPRYDGYCKNNINNKFDLPYVVRFLNPTFGVVTFNDLVRGVITFNNKELDDLILTRSDGTPTYNFCVAIDDWDMNVTHVVRGDEHINNTPRQINILKSLNANIPKYIHVPIILGTDGKKLSKRNGNMSIMKLREQGFLPEALINYIVRLGWSYGDQEIFSINQLKKIFSFSSIKKSASTLNIKKLLWINNFYINNLPSSYVVKHLNYQMNLNYIDINKGPKLIVILKLFGKRYKTLKDIVNNCRYFYEDFIQHDVNLFYKYLHLDITGFFEKIFIILFKLKKWDKLIIIDVIINISKKLILKLNEVCTLLRIALTGVNQSPELYSIIPEIGKIRCLNRIDIVLSLINKIKKK